MQPTDLPEQTKTKKQLIRELVLSDRQYSADEIAKIVHTTKENVWKEKSKMASEQLIVRRTSTKVTAERKYETMSLLPPLSTNSGVEADSRLKSTARSRSLPLKRKSTSDDEHYLRQLNISPVDSEGMKIMYKEFPDKKPADIIAEYGFPPAVVELEYKRYLRLQAIDIDKLQTFIAKLLKFPLKEFESLDDKYKKSGSLTSDEMIEILTAVIYHRSNSTSSPATDMPLA